jgi:hypothetical protein
MIEDADFDEARALETFTTAFSIAFGADAIHVAIATRDDASGEARETWTRVIATLAKRKAA